MNPTDDVHQLGGDPATTPAALGRPAVAIHRSLTHRARNAHPWLAVRGPMAAPLAVLILLTLPQAASAAELVTFLNSPGLTEVTSLNDVGLILGRRELMPEPGVLSSEAYVRVEGTDRAIPLVEGFTNVEPRAVTGSGHVVGFVTRPGGDPDGSQRAFVWTTAEPKPELLPLPDTFRDSCAFDGSHDARVISGYVLGRDPPRLQPCVWRREAAGWSCQLLPAIEAFNPLLVSAQVVISDNGRIVAAPLVAGRSSAGVLEYDLFRWTLDAAGPWEYDAVYDRAIHLGDVNDQGVIVGRALVQGQRRPFIYDPTWGAQVLDLPAGRGGGQANDVNRHGQVVGVWDDPPGPEGTMSAFVWYRGQWTDLPFGIEVAASTANVITDNGRVGGLLVRTPTDEQRADGVNVEAAIESYVLNIDVPPLP